MNWEQMERELTESALEEFLRGNPFPAETLSATEGAWRPQIVAGGWRVETDAASGKARAPDAESGVRTETEESALYFAPKGFLKARADKRPEADEIGLVLAGGGAKGAYQVGVWRALRETGLAARVTGVSGVSIGAINSPLFLLGDWREAYDLWMRMSDPDIRRAQRGEIERLTRVYEKRRREGLFPAWALDLLEDSFISQPELERYLLSAVRRLDAETRRKTALFSAVTPLAETLLLLPGLLDAKIPPVADMLFDAAAHYIPWRGLSNMETVRLLLASSAIPPAYNPIDFRGEMYYDGGIYDNVPIWPLYEAGFRKFIVVELKRERGRPWRAPPDAEPCEFWVIRPGEGFADDFLATFELTPDITAQRVEMGYRDALRVLERFS